MPIYGASLLTEDMLKIWLYLWRGSDICVIVEAQKRAGKAVKSEKLRVHHEPTRHCRKKVLQGDGVLVGGQRWSSMEANVLMAAYSLSVRGSRGDWADGFARARIMSLDVDLMISVEEASGIVTLVGNQLSISQIR